ncbi:MAG: C39 family peptidase [Candidatus Gracilibacteria bacterium]|nr:C39 family peptidase [Candidatus Gracilibacteria bacterium]
MKIIFFIFLIILLSSCSYQTQNDKDILILNQTIKEQRNEIEKLKNREILKQKIETIKNNTYKKKENKLKAQIEILKNQNINNLQEKQDINFEKEKELDIKFYSQFPLDISTGKKYEEPYQNFCEEASLLNGYYYLIGKEPNLKEYDKDLLKLKELEDLLFKGGYKHTSLEETLQLLIAFQGDNQKVFGEIIENPAIEIIKENISKGNPIIAPGYGKGLSNNLFLGGGPIYHNLLIKGYTEQNFIVNEVGVSKGDGYNYKINEIMENIHNFDEKLYPNNFIEGKKEILILYK